MIKAALRRRRTLRRTAFAFVAIMIVGALVPAAHAEPAPVEIVGKLSLDLPENATTTTANTSLIIDSELRLAYQFVQLDDARVLGRAFDLDTHALVKERTYGTEYFAHGLAPPHSISQSVEWVHAHDFESHIVYLAYQEGGTFAGVVAVDGRTLEVLRRFPRVPVVVPESECVGQTSQACLPQTPTVLPVLKGMSWVPPILTGQPPKLLFIMSEPTAFGMERNLSIAWVAQWDADTGVQDWIYRVRACSSHVLPGINPVTGFQLPVFQGRRSTGIYVPCQAGGGTAQVVRLVVDDRNQPKSEQAFPGPLGLDEAMADMEDDRILIKIVSNEGESWWVFDGFSASYTGVVGTTLTLASTGTGLDPTSGRLYVQAPPTKLGRQRDAGGLLMSDVRRMPAPQALAFEALSRDGRGRIHVDVHPETGERHVYVLHAKDDTYDVVIDRVPITEDPPLRDLDRLTTDVEEGPETSSSFTGTGHAYGVRTLVIGGLEGAPPTGPDISGIRVGRFAPSWAGSPCTTNDREVIVGQIGQAGLSNNITSARAAVAELDPSSKTDMGQPSERCYPRPRPRDEDLWRDAEPLAGEYPRPLDADAGDDGVSDADEYLGTQFPLRRTECSGDGKDSSDVRLKPFERGGRGDDSGLPQEIRDLIGSDGSIPDELRSQEVQLERFRADVVCDLEGKRVDASAQALAYEAADVPGIGDIRVGEVSTFVSLYRDDERGLVARSIAMARDISIGDKISIDLAFTLAESWAAGRSGTAGTEFTRRLCGVTIADQAPDVTVDKPSVNPDGPSVSPTGGGTVDKTIEAQGCGEPGNSLIAQPGEKPVLDAINSVLGNRGRASAPEPDTELRQGTPGGYLASVQKDRLEQISARAVNLDPSTQVPALQLIVFNDDPTKGRGRQLYQFAGVDASVTYGIFLLSAADLIDDGFDELDDLLIDLTGGTPPMPEPFPDAGNGAAPPGAAVRDPVRMLFTGISFLLRSPKHALLAAVVWMILLMPAQLAVRRRQLNALSSES